jgi:hypothetical protein
MNLTSLFIFVEMKTDFQLGYRVGIRTTKRKFENLKLKKNGLCIKHERGTINAM